jgi:hypothetical protein
VTGDGRRNVKNRSDYLGGYLWRRGGKRGQEQELQHEIGPEFVGGGECAVSPSAVWVSIVPRGRYTAVAALRTRVQVSTGLHRSLIVGTLAALAPALCPLHVPGATLSAAHRDLSGPFGHGLWRCGRRLWRRGILRRRQDATCPYGPDPAWRTWTCTRTVNRHMTRLFVAY